MTLDEWYISVRTNYKERFGVNPAPTPDLCNLDSRVFERIMRLKLEIMRWKIDPDDRDSIAILAHHTLLDNATQYAFIHPLSWLNQPSYP